MSQIIVFILLICNVKYICKPGLNRSKNKPSSGCRNYFVFSSIKYVIVLTSASAFTEGCIKKTTAESVVVH